jgi:hypothetical protein
MKDSEYNNEPVFYCKSCLSLRIKTVASGLNLDFCDECGSTDIEQAHIEEWRNLYRQRYGFDYLTKEINNGREERNDQAEL